MASNLPSVGFGSAATLPSSAAMVNSGLSKNQPTFGNQFNVQGSNASFASSSDMRGSMSSSFPNSNNSTPSVLTTHASSTVETSSATTIPGKTGGTHAHIPQLPSRPAAGPQVKKDPTAHVSGVPGVNSGHHPPKSGMITITLKGDMN